MQNQFVCFYITRSCIYILNFLAWQIFVHAINFYLFLYCYVLYFNEFYYIFITNLYIFMSKMFLANLSFIEIKKIFILLTNLIKIKVQYLLLIRMLKHVKLWQLRTCFLFYRKLICSFVHSIFLYNLCSFVFLCKNLYSNVKLKTCKLILCCNENKYNNTIMFKVCQQYIFFLSFIYSNCGVFLV